MITYPARRRKSIMNREIRHRSLLEDVPDSELFPRLQADTFDFWEVYYRHNNYFLERNTLLLHKLKANKNFEKASGMNDYSVGFENFIEFYDQLSNSLSGIGVRVCSLIDIITIMKSMSLSILRVNQIVKGLAEKFKVEQEIIERVFKASEENISLLVQRKEERKTIGKTEVFGKVFEYLSSKDCLELVLVNKEYYNSLKEVWIGTKLKECDGLKNNLALRMEMWYSLVSAVSSV